MAMTMMMMMMRTMMMTLADCSYCCIRKPNSNLKPKPSACQVPLIPCTMCDMHAYKIDTIPTG